MDKKAIFDAILAQLHAELERKLTAAQDAARGATDEEAKAEGKYDTRATESAYLARGQAMQVEELAEDLRVLTAFDLPESCTVARPGALIEVNLDGERLTFFLLPRAGGLELTRDGREITVITPATPIGTQLQGKFRGDRFTPRPGAPAGEVLEIH